jgi:hypothetical protein
MASARFDAGFVRDFARALVSVVIVSVGRWVISHGVIFSFSGFG